MRPGLTNNLVMDYQALLDYQPHRTPIQCEGRMVPGLAEAAATERHNVMRHIAVYQQESLAFGGVPSLDYRTIQSPLNTNISGVADQLQDHWVMRIEKLGEELIQETSVGTREQQPLGFNPEVKRRNSSTESDGDPPKSSLSFIDTPDLLSSTSQGSERGKSAWRKIRLYLPDLSPSSSAEDDSVFVEPGSPEPRVSEVKESPEEVVAPQGKGEQERWRFSASELISKLQLTQRRNNFTARLGKSLSTKITLRERGTSSSQEGKRGRRERRCNSAGVATLLHPGSESDSSWLRNKVTEGGGGSAGRPPNEVPQEQSQPPSEERLMRGGRAQKRQSYCERRQSRFLLNSILYQEYSDVAINREIQRQKREDTAGDEEEVTASPKSNLSPSSSFRSQRSSRGSTFSLWQDIPDVRGSGLLNTLTTHERKLQEAKFELVTSEASYVHSLSIAVDHFLNSPELNECLGAQEKQWLFSKLPEVKEISERFLMDLEERLEGDILHFDVCDIVLHHCPELRKKRKRSRSYSPSPVKKKKKKSSKKRKRNRSSSKKRRHSSSSPKSKRRQDKKHKKQSRGRPRKSHRHRHRHSRSSSSEYRSSSCENRLYDLSKDEKHRSKRKRHRCRNSRSVNKKKREDKNQHNLLSTKNRCIHSTNTEISQSVSGLLVTSEKDVCLKEGGNEYDSGNDTCSPPSIQISSSQLMVNQDKESLLHHGFQHASTSGKTPNGHSDNISDSGNSSASCFSFMKDTSLLLGDSQKQKKRILSSCQGCLEEQKISNLLPDRSSPQSCRSRSSSYSTRRSKSRSPSHSVSSYYSRHRSSSGRKSRSRSSSSEARSYSRSRSYSSASGRKSNGSRSSRARRSPSYSRYSSSRDREKSSKYGSTEKSSKGVRRRRRSSYTPLRKRRRDSPSHLEARRITSARKRPIPYYRPSPSSSSGSSTPSWYRTCSRSRSRSFFSHRSSRSRSPSSGRSRSRDWSRSSREHSRSRSWSRSSDSCNSTRR